MQRLSWLLAFWLSSSTVFAALPPLQGTAVYQRLGTDMFRASVYSDHSDWSAWAQPQSQLALEMRIVSDSMSSRRFYRIWNEALAINLDDSKLRAAAEPVGRFLRCVRGTLKPGDKVLISNVDGHSRVSINDVEVLNWPDGALVPLLAHAWVGRFPYSPAFQQQLLGFESEQRAEAVAVVEAIQPQAGRQQVIEGWVTPVAPVPPAVVALAVLPKQSEKATANAIPKTMPKAVVNKAVVEQKSTVPVQVARAPSKEKDVPSQSEPVEQKQPSSEVAAEVTEEQPTMTSESHLKLAVEASGEDSLSQQAAAEVALPDQGQTEQEVVAVAPPAVAAVDWAALQMAEVGYYRQLISQATQAVRYPRRALKRGQEGEVRVLIRLSRDGQIVDLETSSSSRIETLDRAARKAVEDAAPYPAVPELLDDDMLEFELPFRFALTN